MSETNSKKEFANNLIAQDPPPADKLQRHKEALLKEIEHRMHLQKTVIITIYTSLFLVAFGAFMLRMYTDNVVHSICWGTVSLHILLWSLVYILRGIYMEMEGLIEKRLGNDERRRNKNQNLFITIVAIIAFVFSSWLLYRSFFLTNTLKAAKAVGILWFTIPFFIIYPFRTATLIAMLWFEYKKMELNIPKSEEQILKSQTE
jgi:magnesium-transporting ATPase (P-type)